MAVGLKKGFLVEKRVMKVKPSQRRKEGKHVAFVRGIIREIAGYSPLERRGMELLKNGRDKRVLKLCKKRVRAPTNSPQGDMGCGQFLAAEEREESRTVWLQNMEKHMHSLRRLGCAATPTAALPGLSNVGISADRPVRRTGLHP